MEATDRCARGITHIGDAQRSLSIKETRTSCGPVLVRLKIRLRFFTIACRRVWICFVEVPPADSGEAGAPRRDQATMKLVFRPSAIFTVLALVLFALRMAHWRMLIATALACPLGIAFAQS